VTGRQEAERAGGSRSGGSRSGRLDLGLERFGLERFGRLGYGRMLALVTALGALLRLAFLARQPLGYDEDFTAAVLRLSFDRMLDALGRDSAPPLFYLLEWPVAQVLPGAAGLRLVPALAGIALIPLLATLARRVAGDAAGIWAAAFAAVLPATLLSSENARMYSLAGTLVVAATLLLWRAVESSRRDRWLAAGLCCGAAVWTDYFAVIALAGVLVAIASLRPPLRGLAAAALTITTSVATLAVWLALAPTQLRHSGQGFWVPPLSLASVGGTVGQLFAGPPVDSGVPGREALIALQVVAVGAALFVIAAAAVWWHRAAPEPRSAAAFLLLACSGVIFLALASLWRPMFEARYAGVMWLPLFALAGVGLAAVPRPLAGAALAAALAASLTLSAAPTHPETQSLIPDIESRLGDHDLVVADPNHYLVLLADASPQLRARLHVLAAAAPPWYFGTAAYAPDAVIPAAPADVAANGGTIYRVADPGSADPPLPPGYTRIEQRCVVGACLTVFGPVP
jgi:mannosyltransferase